MRRGPVPIPTDILAARGSSVPGRKRQSEPKPKGRLGSASKRLSKEEKSVWKQVVKDLDEMGVGRRPDSRILERYCVEFVLYWKDCQFVREHGTVYSLKDDHGHEKCVAQYPQVGAMHKRAATLLRIEQEFGLTPSARARLHVETENKTLQVSTRTRALIK